MTRQSPSDLHVVHKLQDRTSPKEEWGDDEWPRNLFEVTLHLDYGWWLSTNTEGTTGLIV